MYKVLYDDMIVEAVDLAQAMAYAKTVDRFVTITNGDTEIVGRFGVDSIVDGQCPDGVEYSWMKRRSQ
jgi:hypothetical protein